MKTSNLFLTFSTVAIALACAALLVVAPPAAARETPHAAAATHR